MLDRHEVTAVIRQFIVDNLAASKGVSSITDDDSLTTSGIVDSLGIFQVVAFLQETFDVPIDDDDITVENFSTITTISQFVIDRLDSASGRTATPQAHG